MTDRYLVVTNPRGVVRPRSGAGGAMFPDAIDVLACDMHSDDVLRVRLQVVDDRPVLVGIDAITVTGAPRELSAAEIHGLAGEELTVNAIRLATGAVAAAGGAQRSDWEAEGERAVQGRRRHTMTDGLLRQVRAVAEEHPDAPREAVRAHFHTSLRTASRWIALAKELDDTEQED